MNAIILPKVLAIVCNLMVRKTSLRKLRQAETSIHSNWENFPLLPDVVQFFGPTSHLQCLTMLAPGFGRRRAEFNCSACLAAVDTEAVTPKTDLKKKKFMKRVYNPFRAPSNKNSQN